MRGQRAFAWLQRRAENILAAMLLVMFLVFLLQVASRYLLRWPIGWTHEASVILWLWIVLFGAAFVLRDSEEMRFDLIYGAVGQRARRVMALIASTALVAALIWAMPATWDYVTFMKVQSTAYLKLRFDWLYSIYVIFAVAVILRHLWTGFRAIYGEGPDAADPTRPGSGL